MIYIALSEDIGKGDVTSIITIDKEQVISFKIITKQEIIVCGIDIAKKVFLVLDDKLNLSSSFNDGDKLEQGDTILTGKGNARSIMAAERVALNLLRQSCGVATMTNIYANKIKGYKAKILDTRKTIPGLRELQKYAVTIGGGYNHRFRLDDGVLIKDNHIAICGSVTTAVKNARKHVPALTKIEVECDTLQQVEEAIAAGADIIMLDNMDNATMEKAVKLTNGRVPLEASGNVTLETIVDIAKTGVDFISSGKLTNAPMPVDLGLEVSI